MLRTDINNTIQLEISGMTCVDCSNSIKSYLIKLDGIRSVEINFASESAIIEYNPKIITEGIIKNSIIKLGYTPSEDDSDTLLEEEKKRKLKLQKRKIIVSINLSLIIIFLSMRDHIDYLSFINNIHYKVIYLVLILLSSIVIFWCGNKFLTGAWTALKNKSSNMDSLVSLGTLSSFSYSFIISINHILGINLKIFENTHEVFFETAAMIVTFILIGNYLESILKLRTNTSINRLKNLQSKFVTIIRDGKEFSIPFRKVIKGDLVIIVSGDKVPVDGTIIHGQCIADESTITGESKPKEKLPGCNLISGSILINGAVQLLAENVGNDTTLSKIINLVKEAANSKPKIQRLADKISAIFVPSVIIIAIMTFFIWYIFIGENFDKSLLFSVSVLIIACPCALGLASPMAVVIGIGRAAENGILFNNI